MRSPTAAPLNPLPKLTALTAPLTPLQTRLKAVVRLPPPPAPLRSDHCIAPSASRRGRLFHRRVGAKSCTAKGGRVVSAGKLRCEAGNEKCADQECNGIESGTLLRRCVPVCLHVPLDAPLYRGKACSRRRSGSLLLFPGERNTLRFSQIFEISGKSKGLLTFAARVRTASSTDPSCFRMRKHANGAHHLLREA